MIKRIIVVIAAVAAVWLPMAAQEQAQDSKALSEDFSRRYDLLVSKLGHAGVGVETLLDNWEKVDPENEKMLVARYSYYLSKAQTSSVVAKPKSRYLGNKPLFTLKDSTGVEMSYFEEISYDDELFSQALKSMDKVLKLHPDDLSYYFMKAAALIAYEKESPDMALSYLDYLVDLYYSGEISRWKYPDVEVDEEFFRSAIQEYCYTFFNIGSVTSYEAFRMLSEKMLGSRPKDVVFLSNLGTYYFIGQNDYKQALKYYNKVLKLKPDDYTAIKNCVLLSRRQKDRKLERKYLPMMVKYGPENEAKAAEARLEALK